MQTMRKITMLVLALGLALALGACKKKDEAAAGGGTAGGGGEAAFCETKSKCPKHELQDFEIVMCQEMVTKGVCVAELKATMECMAANEKCKEDGTRDLIETSKACQPQANAQMECQMAEAQKAAPPAAP